MREIISEKDIREEAKYLLQKCTTGREAQRIMAERLNGLYQTWSSEGKVGDQCRVEINGLHRAMSFPFSTDGEHFTTIHVDIDLEQMKVA